MRHWIGCLALVLCAPLAVAQSPCDGRITDQLAHPMDAGAVVKPNPGECYTDPVFGTRICRITDVDPAEGDLAIIKTNYNTMRAWNADGSRLFLWHRAGGRTYEVYEGADPYAHIQTLVLSGSATTGVPSDIESLLWDPIDPLALYYPSNYRYSGSPAPRLYKVTLDPLGGPETQELVRSFESAPTNCPIEFALRLGHAHDMAISANKMVGLSCGDSSNRIQFLYSIAEDQVYGVRQSATPSSGAAPVPFQSGTGAYFQDTGEVTDNNFNSIRTLNLGSYLEHQTLGLAAGADSLNRVNFDPPPGEGSLVSIDLLSGAATVIVGTSNGWPYPRSGTHPSLAAANGSGWIAVSQTGTATGQEVLDNELILANIVSGEVCRIAHTRTLAKTGTWDYWSEAHPQISSDGYRVLFTSDWLGSDTVDTYLLDLSSAAPPAVTYEAMLAWTDNSDDEDGFRVERAATTAGPFVERGTVAADVTNYVDQPIAEGATWCWRLVAFNGGGDSAPSDASCATAAPPIQPPAAPSGVSVVVAGQ